jgi:hypothetical protein
MTAKIVSKNPTDTSPAIVSRQRRVPGLLLPLHTTDGGPGPAIYRPDNPRVVENRRKRLPDGTHLTAQALRFLGAKPSAVENVGEEQAYKVIGLTRRY